MDTQLQRCLTTFDIAVLGIGHMIGAGIYVLTGEVAHNTAGPAIILSFLLAGTASLLAALSYAEFGTRVPKAGSAYSYTYVTVGELWAFVIGWSIVLEHMLCAAAVGRAWSGYLDSLLGNAIKNGTMQYIGHFGGTFMDYPDFIAFFVVIIVSVFIGIGAKTSTTFNNVFTVVNLIVIAFVITYGMTFADFSNWEGSKFMPYGFGGVISGAASCFFAYIGFDGIATSGEEAATPSKSIPRATLVAMSVVSTSYVLMSAALTLMVPSDRIHSTGAFADAFEQRGASWAKYVVAVGALSGMTTSLVGSMFALPRCVYAMANDGLIFQSLAEVHPKTMAPTIATALFGVIAAIISLLFDVHTLVQLLSIGTLMAYTIVSCSVIILRYEPPILAKTPISGQPPVEQEEAPKPVDSNDDAFLITEDYGMGQARLKPRFYFIKPYLEKLPVKKWTTAGAVGLVVYSIGVAGSVNQGKAFQGTWYGILLLILFATMLAMSFALVAIHEQSQESLMFKVRHIFYLYYINAGTS